MFFVSICVFRYFYYETNTHSNSNSDERDTNIVNNVTPYTTIVNYNSKLPSNIINTITQGVVGLSYVDSNDNVTVIQEMQPEVVEKGSGAYGLYRGTLTGYGPDCVGCSKVGNVACFTKNKTNHSLITDGIYYTDDEYGKIRIVAAAKAFPCGTIVYVDNGVLEPFYGIVLDTGSTMRNAYKKDGTIWMDLAFVSQEVALTGGATSKNTKYSVQRWGW